MNPVAQIAAAAGEKAVDYNLGRKNTKYGLQKEFKYYKKYDQYDFNQAMARGLTPWEYYGGPASSGSGPSSPQSTLGNSVDKGAISDAAIASQQMKTQLGVAEIQKESAENVARIQTGQQQKDLDLRIREYKNIHLPQAARKMKLDEQQLKILTNQAATSDPIYQRAIKLLSMGPDNMVASFIAKKYGLNDPNEFDQLSEEMREAMLTEMISASGSIRRELIALFDELLKRITPGGWKPELGDSPPSSPRGDQNRLKDGRKLPPTLGVAG